MWHKTSSPYSDSEIFGYPLFVLQMMRLANAVPLFFQSKKSAPIVPAFSIRQRGRIGYYRPGYRETSVQFYRTFIAFMAFVLSLPAMVIAPSGYSYTLIDQHNPDGHEVRILTLLTYSDNLADIGPKTSQTRNNTQTLSGGKLAGIDDFPGSGSGGFSCLASESFQWQPGCFKPWLERTVLKTNHNGGLKAGNGDGQPSGRAPDPKPKDENNHHQKETREEPQDQENQSPGEGHDGNGNGNNGKDDDESVTKNNDSTQDLQVLANQLINIIESGDPSAVFKLRKIMDELDMLQRLQVLETKGTNSRDESITPLETVLQLQRSLEQNSLRNPFIEQLIEATSDKKQTLNDLDTLPALQTIIPPDPAIPEAGDNNLMILYKIVQDIIQRVNQSDQQPPVGHFEKRCFAEYFVQLFLTYSNPLELIHYLSGQISDLAIRIDIITVAQSFTFPASFADTFAHFHQHPALHELQHFVNEQLIQLRTDPSPHEPVMSSTPQVNSCQSASGTGYSKQGARPKQPALTHQANGLRQKRLKKRRSHGGHSTRLASTSSFVGAGRAMAVPGKKTMDDYININAFRDNTFKVDKVKHAQITDNKCPICCKRFSRTARLVKTPCHHVFHVHCLNLWLQKGLSDLSVKTCPVCRSELNDLREKLNDFISLLKKYGNCHSLDSANRAVKEWNITETCYEALYHFVQLCRHNNQGPDDSQFVNILRTIIHPVTKANIPHDLEINSASFSPDSRRMVTASDDCTAKIYGYKADGSWEEEVTIRHNGPVKSASFSNDNCRVVTASTDHTTKIFGQKDDASWEEEHCVQHTGKVNSATFSADSHHVVTASEDRTAIIFGQKDNRQWGPEVTIRHNGPIQSAAFSPDSSHVMTVGKDNMVKITGRLANGLWKIKTIITHDDAVNSATFSADSHHIVTASDDATAIIYGQQDDGSWEKELTISHIDSDGPIQSAGFSPDDCHVMTVGRDDLVKIYGRQNNGPWVKKAIIAHEDRINSATFSADGCHLATASDDNTAKIYGKKTDASWEEEITICHYHKVLSATFTPSSRRLITTSIDRASKEYCQNDNGSWKEDSPTLYKDWVCFPSATFSTDSRFAATFTIDRKTKIHTLEGDASSKKEISTCHSGTVLSANFSANSRFLVTTHFVSYGRHHSAKITELWKEE